MKIEKIIKQTQLLNLMKNDLIKYLLELKKEYPVYLEKVNNEMIILNINLVKSKIPTINFYDIEVAQNGVIFDVIYIPSNINYLKTLEYELLRNDILMKIHSFRKTIKGDDYDQVVYDDIVEKIRNVKKRYLNMYKKETNIFKEEISFLYNLQYSKTKNHGENL